MQMIAGCYGFSIDWWAVGVMAYEMATGRVRCLYFRFIGKLFYYHSFLYLQLYSPFQGNTKQELYESIVRERVFFPGKINGKLMDLIERVSGNKCSKVKDVKEHIIINNKNVLL